MTREDFYNQFKSGSIEESCKVKVGLFDLDHEVYNPKSANFLNFAHFQDSENSKAPKGIRTEVIATHAFRPTSNNMLYATKEIKDAIPTVLDPYQIPVRGRHPGIMDPDNSVIGRAVSASFQDTVNSFSLSKLEANPLAVLKNSASDPMFLDSVRRASSKPEFKDLNYKGAGYLLIDSIVTDPEWVEKILDGRELTVSIEAKATEFYNPISGNRWMEDIENVDYVPGDIFEGQLSLAVPEGIRYLGYAYTSIPADPHARTSRVDILDSVQVQAWKERYLNTMVVAGFDVTNNVIQDSAAGSRNPAIEPVSTGVEMKTKEELALLISDSVKEGASLSKEDALAFVAVSRGVESVSESILDSVSSLFIWNGIPVLDKEIYDSIASIEGLDLADDEKMTRLGAFFSEKTPENENSGTITDRGTADEPKEGVEVNLQTILDALKDEELLNEVVKSFNLVKDSEVSELNEKLSLKEKDLELALAKVDLFRSEIKDAMVTEASLKSALDTAIADARDSATKLRVTLGQIADKDFSEQTLESKSLTAMISESNEIMDSLNFDDVKAKLFPIVKEIADSNVENPADTSSQAQPEASVETRYSRRELEVSKKWNQIYDSDGPGAAAQYLFTMRRRGVVSGTFLPDVVKPQDN